MVAEGGAKPTTIQFDDFTHKIGTTYKGVIFSGAPKLLTQLEPEPFVARAQSIATGKIPTLGICFGHQLLGLLFGAEVYLGKEVREPTAITSLKPEHPLWKGLPAEASFAQDHTEGIHLPSGFACLAESKYYRVEAMAHSSLPLWGVQFHPEVSGAHGQQLVNNFLKMCLHF